MYGIVQYIYHYTPDKSYSKLYVLPACEHLVSINLCSRRAFLCDVCVTVTAIDGILHWGNHMSMWGELRGELRAPPHTRDSFRSLLQV